MATQERLKINPEQEVKKIVEFLKTTFKTQGFSKGLVAVSGGVDSATTLLLTVKALGKENVFSLQLPNKNQPIENGSLIIEQAGLAKESQLLIDISEAVDKLTANLKADEDQVRQGNIIARVRMICLFDQAKKHQALVVGTENKSENVLGYYTRFGDAASDLEPIGHLYKTQVYQLAQYLGVPGKILSAAPSAGLWAEQTDAKELGFDYAEADPVLHLLIDEQMRPEQIIQHGFDKDLVNKIIQRLKAVKFKKEVPYEPNQS
jgi:NAD+ synthase